MAVTQLHFLKNTHTNLKYGISHSKCFLLVIIPQQNKLFFERLLVHDNKIAPLSCKSDEENGSGFYSLIPLEWNQNPRLGYPVFPGPQNSLCWHKGSTTWKRTMSGSWHSCWPPVAWCLPGLALSSTPFPGCLFISLLATIYQDCSCGLFALWSS